MKFTLDAHNFHDLGIFPHTLLMDDAMNFHGKFSILFSHFCPNCTHGFCYLASHTCSSVCCQLL